MPASTFAHWLHRGAGAARRATIGASGLLLLATPALAQFGLPFPGFPFNFGQPPQRYAPPPREPLMPPETRVAIQRSLQALGLYDGPLDGALGGSTRRAIVAYQRQSGQPGTGSLTGAQIRRLLQTPPEGDSSATAQRLGPTAPDAAASIVKVAAQTGKAQGPVPAAARSEAPFEVRSHIYVGAEYLGNVQGLPEPLSSQHRKLERWLELYGLSKVRAENPDAVPSGGMMTRLMSQSLNKAEIADLLRNVNVFAGQAKKEVIGQLAPGSESAFQVYLSRLNSLELADMQKRFAQDYLPRIVPQTVAPPARLVLVSSARLKDYDDGVGGFRFYKPSGRMRPPGWFVTTMEVAVPAVPDWFPIARDKARVLSSRQSEVYLAVFCDVGDIDVNASIRPERAGMRAFHLPVEETDMFQHLRSRSSQYYNDAGPYVPQRQGSMKLIPTGIGIFADPMLKELIASLPLAPDQPGVIPDASGRNPAQQPPAPGRTSDAATSTGAEPAQPAAGRSGAVAESGPAKLGGNAPDRALPSVFEGLHTIQGAVALGDDGFYAARFRSLAWAAGKRTYGELEDAARQQTQIQTVGLLRYFTALGYAGWVRQSPDASTPPAIASRLMVLWLDEPQVRSLFKDLTDRQLKPISLFLKPGDLLSQRTFSMESAVGRLDDQSRAELLARFDARHRLRILQAAAAAPRKLVIGAVFPLGNYDFEKGGFPYATGTGSSSDVSKSRELTDFLGLDQGNWIDARLQFKAPDWPPALRMGTDEARKTLADATKSGGVAQFYNATFVTVNDVTLSTDKFRLKMAVDAAYEGRGTYADAGLTKLIWQASEPAETVAAPPATASAPPVPSPAPPPLPASMAAAAPASSAPEGQAPLPAAPPIAPPAPAKSDTVTPEPAPAKPQVQAALSPPAPGPALQPAPTNEPGPPAFDVVGIRLGMDLAEAEPFVRQHMPEHRVLDMTPVDPRKPVTFSTARVYVSPDNAEYLALVIQPDRTGGRIVAIGRYVFGGLGAFDREQLIGDLSAKYGGKPIRGPEFLHWGGEPSNNRGETACHLVLGTIGNATWRDAQGQTPTWSDYVPAAAAGTGWRGPASMNWLSLRITDMQRLNAYAKCLPTVAVWAPDINGRTAEFSLWLSDTKAYVDILTRPPLSGSGAGTVGSKVKL